MLFITLLLLRWQKLHTRSASSFFDFYKLRLLASTHPLFTFIHSILDVSIFGDSTQT